MKPNVGVCLKCMYIRQYDWQSKPYHCYVCTLADYKDNTGTEILIGYDDGDTGRKIRYKVEVPSRCPYKLEQVVCQQDSKSA